MCVVQSGALGKATPSSVIPVCVEAVPGPRTCTLNLLMTSTVACFKFDPTQGCERRKENMTWSESQGKVKWVLCLCLRNDGAISNFNSYDI